MTPERKRTLNLYQFFHRAWDRPAAYHLARIHSDPDWKNRFISAMWLISARIPFTGEARSMNFRGLPSRW